MPRVSFPGGARPAPWDRNPTNVSDTYVVIGIAPHAQAQRWTYTVPAGKKALISGLIAQAYRLTAPSASGDVLIDIRIASTTVIMAFFNEAAVAAYKSVVISPEQYIAAGVTVDARTADGSTGGTTVLLVAANITEFDA